VASRVAAPPIAPARGRQLDLNLLVALDALLVEGNVTRAAERLGLSQPAMSHALNRLRVLLDDPILVRTPRGMVPTPRAEELAPAIHAALDDIDRALRGRPPFDPSTARRAFTIAAVDLSELTILPPLLARIAEDAPGIDLLVRPLRLDTIEEELESGLVDVAFVVLNADDDLGALRQRLFHESFVCVVRADHPTVGEALTIEEFVALDHALVGPRGRRGGFVDSELARLGLTRRVALMVPHFLVAPMVVAKSDLILTLPERIARAFAAILPLRIVPTPAPLTLAGFDVSQIWHERQSLDPAHAWLRGLIADVCRKL
jgi:DNA-binding transcriptional LysR family regulator